MDVFPTLSRLANVPLPKDTVLDGRDMTDILLRPNGKSQHDFLFIYGTCVGQKPSRTVIMAVRHGPYKAHFCTSPGLGGNISDVTVFHKYPLLFDIDQDPSEAFPICTGDRLPEHNPEANAAISRILRAYAMEKATFEYGHIPPLPPGPGEGPDRYGLCCDRSKNCFCEGSQWNDEFVGSIFNIGSRDHHNRYHDLVGEENHMHPS